jgi:hypothetical protein
MNEGHQIEPDSKQKQLAVQIAQKASPDENTALRTWAHGLLALRDKQVSVLTKGKEAISLTIKSKVAWTLIKMMAKEIKKHGWDDRSSTTKVGLAGAAVGLTFFPGAGAGIAALGGAVGVPLWVVLGGGSVFAKLLIGELLERSKVEPPDKPEEKPYKTIDV